MVRFPLDERQWLKVKAALRVRKSAGRPGRDDRNFVEAALCPTVEPIEPLALLPETLARADHDRRE
jgi:hypothetical protein